MSSGRPSNRINLDQSTLVSRGSDQPRQPRLLNNECGLSQGNLEAHSDCICSPPPPRRSPPPPRRLPPVIPLMDNHGSEHPLQAVGRGRMRVSSGRKRSYARSKQSEVHTRWTDACFKRSDVVGRAF